MIRLYKLAPGIGLLMLRLGYLAATRVNALAWNK